ncbi:MAG: hypothetical protein NVV63_13645 [Opitutus sp.]|nr:hypothetical protein [Opitutus sp.]
MLAELELPGCEEGIAGSCAARAAREGAEDHDQRQFAIASGGSSDSANTGSIFTDRASRVASLKESCQLELLDLFGRAGDALAAYRKDYTRWKDVLAERLRIASETKLSPDQIDFLQGQLSRLDSLTLTDDAIAALERDFARMNRAQELIELTGIALNGLVGEEGLQVPIASFLREARHLENIDPSEQAARRSPGFRRRRDQRPRRRVFRSRSATAVSIPNRPRNSPRR